MSLIYNATFDSQTRILSLLDKAGNVISSCEVPSKELVDNPNKPLMLRSLENASSVTLKKNGTLSNTYQISTDGTNWTNYTLGTQISLKKEDVVYFRCSNHPTTQSSSNYVSFSMTGKIEAWHNAYSMISSDFSSAEGSVGDHGMYSLFESCTSLTKAPLLLNALSPYCYTYMFYRCASLKEVRISATKTANGALDYWLVGVSETGDFYCDPTITYPTGESGIPKNWNRWVYGAEDTETTTTMYRNGVAETIRVGTSSYGTCYSAQGWEDFKTLDDMHKDGYTFGAQTPITMYFYDTLVPSYSCEANAEDGFTETMYDVGDGNNYLTMEQQNSHGYYLTSKPFTGLTLTATSDNSRVSLKRNGSLSNTFKVYTGNGWKDYGFNTVIPLNAGESVKWVCSAHPTTQSDSRYVQFVMSGAVEASGNINSMLSVNFEDITSYASGTYYNPYDYGFYRLFYNCSALTRADIIPTFESKVDIDAHGLFSYLFAGCTGLTSVSPLPSVHICCRRNNNWRMYPDYTFTRMFENCSRLHTIGSLNILSDSNTNMYEGGRSIYFGMFRGCASLESIDIIGSLRGYDYCCEEMFKGCSSLSSISQSSFDVTQLTNYYKTFSQTNKHTPEGFARRMFEGCVSLQDASCMSVSSRSSYGCDGMFLNCTSLTNPPSNIYCANQVYLSWYDDGGTAGKYATCIDPLREAFKGCTLLNTVNVATPPYEENTDWLDGCSATGSLFTDITAKWSSGVSGIPEGWDRFIYNATDTGATATMYRNKSTETVRVGTYSGGSCYSAQGWAGFKTLDSMHELGYTFQEPVPTTMYHNGSTTTIDKIEAGGADGFTKDRYILNSAYLTLTEMHVLGYTFGAQSPLTMYLYDSPLSTSSVAANAEDGFTETMYDVGDGKGYLTIEQQNKKGYYLTETPFTGLTLTATEDNSSVKLIKSGTLSNTYAVNTGNGWEAYTFGTVIPLNTGESCKWRCLAHPTTQSDSRYIKFVMTGTIEASGNVNSMLLSGFKDMTSLSGYSYAFCRLFNGCTSLTKSPNLPATTLAYACYYNMLYGCSKLKEVRISATTTASYALSNWLYGVAASGTVYADPSFTDLPENSASGVPSGWVRAPLSDYPVNP